MVHPDRVEQKQEYRREAEQVSAGDAEHDPKYAKHQFSTSLSVEPDAPGHCCAVSSSSRVMLLPLDDPDQDNEYDADQR